MVAEKERERTKQSKNERRFLYVPGKTLVEPGCALAEHQSSTKHFGNCKFKFTKMFKLFIRCHVSFFTKKICFEA